MEYWWNNGAHVIYGSDQPLLKLYLWPTHEMELDTAKVTKDLRQTVIDPREITTAIIRLNEHRNKTLNAILL